ISAANDKPPPPNHCCFGLVLPEPANLLSGEANERSISRQGGWGAATCRFGRSSRSLLVAEFGLAFLAECGDAFARILVHEQEREAVDGMSDVVAAQPAIVERLCHPHCEPGLCGDLLGKGEGAGE